MLLMLAKHMYINVYNIMYVRFGVCEAYGVNTTKADVCKDILRPGIDFVFISHNHGSQDEITALLNEKISIFFTTGTDDMHCLEMIFRVACHYYLPPCGNSMHPLPPYSLCQDECDHVRSKCEAVWEVAEFVFGGSDSFINCSETSRLLFPLPNCCTGAGITLSNNHKQQSTTTATVPSDTDSSLSGGAVAGIVIAVMAVLAVSIVAALLVIRYRHTLIKKKVVERMQMDILARQE